MSVTCVRCGGTDFYKEAGFYFCSDCQTQTQDIQEHVFEDQEDEDQDQAPKRVVKKKSKQPTKTRVEERLTSWECYNYILLGLVNELIDLGADENLRTTVEVLWFHYLKNIEVIREGNLPPKLPAINIQRDAAIIYGRTKSVKRPRSRSRSAGSVTDTSTLDKESIRRERTKQKRALARSEYDDFLSFTQQSDTSLVNQSLQSLKSPSSSNVDSKVLQYNKSASSYLKKRMKGSHLKRHCEDVNSILDCHQKFTRRTVGTYYVDPSLLSRSKLFSLLYLGLLINKDKIQLGDMLRYIREGHLSFQHVDHFFPEESVEKGLNVCSFTKGPAFMSHSVTRSYTAKLATFLNVKKYVPIQNIVELCERYCKELNLPNSVYNHTLNIISRTLPKFPLLTPLPLPNYEGRTIAFIIFTLKLLFGLDDATEFEMSNLASTINEHLEVSAQKMFNFEHWLTYIQYRHFVLSQHNFGVSYTENSLDETKCFINHLEIYCEKHQIMNDETAELQIFKRMLDKMQHVWESDQGGISYDPSLTPYKDYIEILMSNNISNSFDKSLLGLNCWNMSLDFLFYTELYLNNISSTENIVYKHGGKNDDIQFTYMFDAYKKYRKKSNQTKSLFNVTLLSEQNPSSFLSFFKEPKGYDTKLKPNSQELIDEFEHSTVKKLKRNFKRRQKLFKNVDINIKETNSIYPSKSVIYEPSERFCANLQNVALYSDEKWEKFYNAFSLSFRILLKECARITEQSTKDVYLEYLKIETYLTFILDIGKDRPFKENIVNSDLKNNIQHTMRTW